MKLEGLVDAVFLKRENRFAATVLMGGGAVACHVPNSGRLAELLTEGAPARVLSFSGLGRTVCGLVMVKNLGQWVIIDAHRANAVAAEAVEAGLVPGLERAENLRREVACGHSRFDMACTVGGKPTYIEVKCSTLHRDGVGIFPDAPTERGRRHLSELAELSRGGIGCHALFMLQHPASSSFSPNHETDPAFTDALSAAIASGVHVHALVCRTGPDFIQVIKSIEINQ